MIDKSQSYWIIKVSSIVAEIRILEMGLLEMTEEVRKLKLEVLKSLLRTAEKRLNKSEEIGVGD